MSIEALRAALPAYARDIATNLSVLAEETVLPDQAKWGCFVASAHAVGEPSALRAIEAAAVAAGAFRPKRSRRPRPPRRSWP